MKWAIGCTSVAMFFLYTMHRAFREYGVLGCLMELAVWFVSLCGGSLVRWLLS